MPPKILIMDCPACNVGHEITPGIQRCPNGHFWCILEKRGAPDRYMLVNADDVVTINGRHYFDGGKLL